MLFSEYRDPLAPHTLCWLFFGVCRNSILILGCKKPWYTGSIGWFGIRFDTQAGVVAIGRAYSDLLVSHRPNLIHCDTRRTMWDANAVEELDAGPEL